MKVKHRTSKFTCFYSNYVLDFPLTELSLIKIVHVQHYIAWYLLSLFLFCQMVSTRQASTPRVSRSMLMPSR